MHTSSRRLAAVAVLMTLASGPLVAQNRPAAVPAADLEALEMHVRATEIAFAMTMANRDLDAFAAHLSEEAVFIGRRDVHRGPAEIVAAWSGYFEEETPPFSWAPEYVEVLESGTLALSSGPVRNPDGGEIGTFNSVWRLEADGVWRVVFDKGCP